VPTELAQAIAELVLSEALSERVVSDLHPMLGHTLSRPDPASYRWDLLNPLSSLIHERAGDLPTAREYETARQLRFPGAAAASSLSERYGSWIKALAVASRLINHSKDTPITTGRRHQSRSYAPRDCTAAIAQFFQRFGTWPSPTEYREWARAHTDAMRRFGGDPRLPSIDIVYRRFGTFANAVAAAQSVYETIDTASA
jgi:hypothetical protein